MDFNLKLQNYCDLCEERLRYYISKIENKSIVSEAMEYSLMIGGKRIRPVLALAFCEMLGGENCVSAALPYACAVEMIHTYSLIHDDLPCMDDDDMRRGKPSCHKKFGEEYALLAGDALLNLAFEIVFGKYSDIDAEKSLACGKILSEASGINGMIGGQTIDLLSENKSISLEELKLLHSMKTGAMIIAPCKIGALVGGGSDEDIKKAERYGANIGLCFQIVDDILDVTSTTEKLGKPVGSDEGNKKSTYVSLMGLESAQKTADELTQEALECLNNYEEKAWFLKQLAVYLAKRDK